MCSKSLLSNVLEVEKRVDFRDSLADWKKPAIVTYTIPNFCISLTGQVVSEKDSVGFLLERNIYRELWGYMFGVRLTES
jgi:hypothetical protein